MPKIQLRHDTAANWTTANPTLLAGEAGIETDTGKFKLGNGTDNWTTLAYAQGDIKDYVAGTGINIDILREALYVDTSTKYFLEQQIINHGAPDVTKDLEIIYRVPYLSSGSSDGLYWSRTTSASDNNNKNNYALFINARNGYASYRIREVNTNYNIVQIPSGGYADIKAKWNAATKVWDLSSKLNTESEFTYKVSIQPDDTVPTSSQLSSTRYQTTNLEDVANLHINYIDETKTAINVIPATSSVIGGVKPDGTTTTVDTNGTITAVTDPGGTIQTQINGLQTGLTSLQTEVTTLSGNVSTITTEFSALDSRVDATESDIEALTTTINQKTDKAQAATSSMPSSRYIDLTLGASPMTYTAIADGWMVFRKQNANNANQFIQLINETTSVATAVTHSGTNFDETVYLPVRKNDQITVEYNAGGALDYLRFVYADGTPTVTGGNNG